jgi:5'-3' exonuclease
MKQLTKIEQLDESYPGLADNVRKWFDHGVQVRKVAELLFQQYNVCVPRATIGNFRARRWACEREGRHRAAIRREAVEEVCRELAMKDSPETPTASLQTKVRSLLNPDVSVAFKPAVLNRARD